MLLFSIFYITKTLQIVGHRILMNSVYVFIEFVIWKPSH